MIVALILFSSIITAIITAVELYLDYRSDISAIETRFEFIGNSYLPTLTESVWVADDIQISTQLDGLSRLQDIEALNISVNQQSRWYGGTIRSNRTIEKTVPIIRTYQGRALQIGELHIVASVDAVLNRLWTKLVAILISNGVKTLLVSLFMLIIFQLMVGRHLEHIANYLRSMGKDPNNSPELKLARAETGRWRPDALDQVNQSINNMRKDVALHNHEILKLNNQLEKRVEQRTKELHQLNSRLATTLEKLKLSSDAKSTFLSRVSHELRTPLNAICGFAQLLPMEPLSSDQVEYVDWIYESGQHLTKLINDLLDLSRIEVGELPLDMDSLSITEVIHTATTMTELQRLAKHIQLIKQCSEDYCVLADITRLNQIIINLLSNAIKYIPEHGEITIGCNLTETGMVRISVCDNGPGIAENMQDKIFSPFERLGAELTEIEGTGTGLALSKNLAEMMGGRLDYHSQKDHGSCFWVDLKPGNMSIASDRSSSETEPASIADYDGKKYTILYIEDNPGNQKLVERILHYHSAYTLYQSMDGISGLQQAQQLLPDLILLDIQLPEMNGFEVLKHLQQNSKTRNIPVIAVTADAMPADVSRGMAAGFHQYVTKPINANELIETIESTLKH